jgi:hypothetical protein
MTDAIDAIVDFAATISRQEDSSRWGLADLILTATPADMPQPHVSATLNKATLALGERGVTKADGSPYFPDYLANQRKTALAWDPSERQPDDASFEVHAENRSEAKKPVLIALCAVHRGEQVERPAGVERQSWANAIAKVRTAKMGKVQTQAVRIALGKRAKNTPTNLRGATFNELVRHIMIGVDGLEALDGKLDTHPLNQEEAGRLLKALKAQAEVNARVQTRVEAKLEMSDEALADLLRG